jgi:hypothetical protein
MNNNEEYIKKLEETNKLLEEANRGLYESIATYKLLRLHLTVALATCRTLIYDHVVRNSPKRNEKADREFDVTLEAIKAEARLHIDRPFDVSPDFLDTYEKIKVFLAELENTPLDKKQKVI